MPIQPDGSIHGTNDADILVGDDGNDTILGFDGDDSLSGEDGDDSLVGGAGNDTLRGGHGDDTLIGGEGDDEIEGLYGNDVIDTGAGNDHVFGRDGDDLIYGREGNDHLIGSIGTDTVYGGAGNDTLAGSQGNDEMHGGDGNDLVFIGVYEDSDRIFMDAGNDFVDGASAGSSFYAEGGDGNDVLNSGVGDDTLLGGAGNDILHGGAGNDTLSGGGDNDIVTGGDGDDVFVLQDVPGSLQILDFGANGAADMIDLSQITDYETAADVSAVMTFDQTTTTLSFAVTGGELVVSIHSEAPLTAEDLGLTGILVGTELEDTGGGDDSTGGGGDDTTGGGDTGGGGGGGSNDTYTIEGPDAGHFVVDPNTGELSNMDWFIPSHTRVWDVNGDGIYEVSVIEHDATSAEIGRSDMELVVTPSGATWRTADGGDDTTGGGGDDTTDGGGDDSTDGGGDDTTGGGGDDTTGGGGDDTTGGGGDDTTGGGGDDTTGGDSVFTLQGEDAGVFQVDADNGEVSYQQWFTPSYDEVWDMDRDHIYEVSVVETNSAGDEIGRSDMELIVSETDAVWQEADPTNTDDDDTGSGDTGSGDTGTGGQDPQDPDQSVDGSGGTEGLSYTLAGHDADIFDIQGDTGVVTFKSWFEPSYDDVWDLDRDHIYEISVHGTDDAGDEVVRTDLELVVSPTDATWRVAPGDGDAQGDTGADLMALLFTPLSDENEIPADDDIEDIEAESF